MTIKNFPNTINTKFYSMSKTPQPNTERNEYASGRAVVWQKNTKKNFKYSVKLRLKVDTELETFWNFFNDDLGQTAGFFYCPALGSGVYRFIEIPTQDDTDRDTTTINMEIEEV